MKRIAQVAFAAAVVAAGAAVSGAASAATNLITNGSFENGMTGWTLTSVGSGQGYSPTVIIVTDGVGRAYPAGAYGEGVPVDTAGGLDPDPAGTHAAYFSSDVGSETLSQTISLGQGTYEVGFDAYIPLNGYNNRNDASFTATVGGFSWSAVDLKRTAGAPQVWTHSSGFVNVGPGGGPTSFVFAANGFPAVDVAIDRVYAIAVPEPASWALMLVGFGGLGAVLRRRRHAVAA